MLLYAILRKMLCRECSCEMHVVCPSDGECVCPECGLVLDYDADTATPCSADSGATVPVVPTRDGRKEVEKYLSKVLQRLGVRIESPTRVWCLVSAMVNFKRVLYLEGGGSANYPMFLHLFMTRCTESVWPERPALLSALEARLPKSKSARRKATVAFERWWAQCLAER